MQESFEKVIVRLAEAQVEFVVVGGVSAVIQGTPIITFDLDICYRRTPENIRRLAAALAPLQPRLRGLPEGLPNIFDEHSLLQGTNFTLELAGDGVDLLGEMIAVGRYEDVVADAVEVEVSGWRVKVMSLSHLIATKRAAGRPKDLAALPMIEATLERKKQKGN